MAAPASSIFVVDVITDDASGLALLSSGISSSSASFKFSASEHVFGELRTALSSTGVICTSLDMLLGVGRVSFKMWFGDFGLGDIRKAEALEWFGVLAG